MFRIRQLDTHHNNEIFNELDRSLFPLDGRFIEIFQLWVDPRYRRKGLATELKMKVEEYAINNSIGMLYTHTEEANSHVIKLNEQLGYRQVRKGPIWDEVIRVSLMKDLYCVNG
jgi:GNAT superfamily N-acetyltransferase